MDYWRRCNQAKFGWKPLTQLARSILGIVACLVSVECLSSQAGLTPEGKSRSFKAGHMVKEICFDIWIPCDSINEGNIVRVT